MLLAKKDRGKPTEAQRQIVLAPFGADKAKEFLDGVETLPMENDEEAMDVEENEEKEKDWADGVWKDVERTAEEDLDEDEIKARIEKEKEREEKIGRDELLKMKNERAKEISMARILTQEEHQKIKAEQAMKGVVDIRRNLKSQLETSNSANKVSLSKIETVTSRRVSKETVNLRGLILIFRNTIKKADWLRYWQVVRTGQLMVKPSVKSIIQMHQRQIKTRKRINHSL